MARSKDIHVSEIKKKTALSLKVSTLITDCLYLKIQCPLAMESKTKFAIQTSSLFSNRRIILSTKFFINSAYYLSVHPSMCVYMHRSIYRRLLKFVFFSVNCMSSFSWLLENMSVCLSLSISCHSLSLSLNVYPCNHLIIDSSTCLYIFIIISISSISVPISCL